MPQSTANLVFSRNVWKRILICWVAIWLSVFFKNLFVKGYLNEYVELLKRHSLEEKRSFVTGDRLYEFIQFCKSSLPEKASYGYRGINEEWIDDRRIRYYLYPSLKGTEPDYILVYDAEIRGADKNLQVYKRLDEKRYILKRVK